MMELTTTLQLVLCLVLPALFLFPAGLLARTAMPRFLVLVFAAGVFVPAGLFFKGLLYQGLLFVSAFCLEVVLLHERAVKIPREEILSAKTLGLTRHEIRSQLVYPVMRGAYLLSYAAALFRILCAYDLRFAVGVLVCAALLFITGRKR